MNKTLINQLLLGIVICLFSVKGFTQYYGFDLKPKYYSISKSSKTNYPFKKMLPGYTLLSNSITVDSNQIIAVEDSTYFRALRSNTFSNISIGLFKDELVSADYFSDPSVIASVRGPIISNGEYRKFVSYVRDSIAHFLLAEYGNPIQVGSHYKTDRLGTPIEYINERGSVYYQINWEEEIDWSLGTVQLILEDPNVGVFLGERERLNRTKRIDPRKLNFDNYTFTFYSLLRKGLAQKNFHQLLSNIDSARYYAPHTVNNVYPDTNFWLFQALNMEDNFKIALSKFYFSHPYFDRYPVQGLGLFQMESLIAYKTQYHNQLIGKNIERTRDSNELKVIYRLPEAKELSKIEGKNVKIPLDTATIIETFTITEAKYFVFLKYVCDSISHYNLAEYGDREQIGSHYKIDKAGAIIEYGDQFPYFLINWNAEINWEQPSVKMILEGNNIIESTTNQFNPSLICYSFQDVNWRKLISDEKEDLKNNHVNMNQDFIFQVICVFPQNDFGKIFLKNYPYSRFSNEQFKKWTKTPIKGLSYEQACAFYHWWNKFHKLPKGENPINHYLIPTREQWEKLNRGEALNLPTEINLLNFTQKQEISIQNTPFRLMYDVYKE